MRIVSYANYGQPADVVHLLECPEPEPGEGEVVIALEAAPVHLADIKNITGQPWFRAPLPATPGYEGVGRIESVGAGVAGFKPGDRVFLPTGFGTWREKFLAPAQGLWRAPEAMSAEQLALVPINLQTAYLMLVEGGALTAGQWIIQNAANSNVGYYVIRLAKRMGLRTINVARRLDALSAVQDAGADAVLVDSDALALQVSEIAQDVRLAIDAVGGAATSRLAACLGYGGVVLNYGFLSGDTCEISAQQMMFQQLSLRGFFTKASLARMEQADIARMRAELAAFLEEDLPEAPIAGVYSFADIQEALAHAARTGSERAGKVIIKP